MRHFLLKISIFLFVVGCISSSDPEASNARSISSVTTTDTLSIASFIEKSRGPLKRHINNLAVRKKHRQSCAADLCGPIPVAMTLSRLSSIEAEPAKLYTPENADYKAVEKTIVDAIRVSVESSKMDFLNRKILDEHKAYKPHPSMVQLAHSVYFMALYNLIRWKVWFTQNPGRLNVDNEVEYFPVDRATFLTALAEMSLPNKEWTLKVFEKSGFFEELEKYRENSQLQLLAHDFTVRYPDMSYAQAIKQSFKDCRTRLNLISRNTFLKMSMIRKAFPICLSATSKGISINERIYKSELSLIDTIELLFNPKFTSVLLEQPWNWNADYESYKKSKIHARDGMILDVTEDDIVKSSEEIVKHCHEKLKNAYEFAVTKDHQRLVDSNISKIRKVAGSLLQTRDKTFNKKLLNAISSVQFFYLTDRKQLIDNFKLHLNSYAKYPTPTNFDEQMHLALFGTVGVSLGLMFNDESDDRVPADKPIDTIMGMNNDIKDLCDTYGESLLTDHITQTGASYLSWTTVRYPEYGLGVIAHELSHYISFYFADQTKKNPGHNYRNLPVKIPLWERRRCVNTFHPYVKPSDSSAIIDTSGESQFTEEDWADYFSGEIIKRLKTEGVATKNFGCILLSSEKNEFEDGVYNSAYSQHSEALFRAIHIEKTTTGRLPSSCNKVVENRITPQCF